MGGSGGIHLGGGFPQFNEGDPEYIEFELVIRQGDEARVWGICQVGNDIEIQDLGGNVPALTVLLDDETIIGVVPPNYGRTIAQHLNNTGSLSGEIIRKNGNEISPHITIRVYL